MATARSPVLPVIPDSERHRIRRFVQQGLGCGCPDEVFERIDVGRDHAGAALQLAIGERLLIRVHVLDGTDDLLRYLPSCIAEGVRERAALGLKRLRLVLAAGNPEAVEAPARGVFERAVAGLGDVHLHVRGLASLREALGEELLPHAAAAERRISR